LNNPSSRISSQTRQRVRETAAMLGYRAPSSLPPSARVSVRPIAFVASGIYDPFFSPVTAGVLRAAEDSHTFLTMVPVVRDATKTAQLISSLRMQQPRGILLGGTRSLDDPTFQDVVAELQSYEDDGGHVVVVGQTGLPFDTVTVDDVAGGKAVGEALLALGYREFFVVAGGQRMLVSHDRIKGFRAALEAAGIRLGGDRVIAAELNQNGGYTAAGEILRRGFDSGAAFAVTDSMAVGVLARLREAGIPVPGQIGVAGFDDAPGIRDVIVPPLTTYHAPWELVGEQAIRLVLADRSETPRVRTESGHVLVRQSTQPLHRSD
jgi:LacI family transcriptional regulator